MWRCGRVRRQRSGVGRGWIDCKCIATGNVGVSIAAGAGRYWWGGGQRRMRPGAAGRMRPGAAGRMVEECGMLAWGV